jgi:acyl carrier protein
LRINYPIKSKESAFSDIIIENEDNNMDNLINESCDDDLDPDALMDSLMNLDLINELKDEIDFSMDNFHDVWIDPNFDLELLKTMTRQVISYQPKKILERTLNIKYQILASLITNINLINRKTIVSIKKYLNNINFVYALIYIYDKQFSNLDTPSPTGCEIKIDPDFDKTYNIQTDGDI